MFKTQNSKLVSRFGFIFWNLLRVSKFGFRISARRGITLLLVILVLGALLSISLGIFSVVLAEIRLSGELIDSFHALYNADRGMEKLLYLDRVANSVCPPYDEGSGSYPPCPPYSNGMSFPVTIGPLANGGCMALNLARVSNQVTISSVGQQNCTVSEIAVKRALFARYTKDVAGGFPTPVAFWKFDEGSGGVVNDSSGNDNTGTLTNGPLWSAPGKSGASALFFDGSNDYVEAPSTGSLAITGNITIAAWVNVTDYSTYNGIVGKTVVNVPAPYDFYLVQGTGIPRFLRGNGGAFASVSAINPVPTGQWHFIAVTMSGTTVTHYLDGVPNGSGTLSTTIADGANPLRIGSRMDLVTRMNGRMDEVRVYNTALTQSQIQAIMSSP